jgi:uncharacterized protein YeaO (DUF488 family)
MKSSFDKGFNLHSPLIHLLRIYKGPSTSLSQEKKVKSFFRFSTRWQNDLKHAQSPKLEQLHEIAVTFLCAAA